MPKLSLIYSSLALCWLITGCVSPPPPASLPEEPAVAPPASWPQWIDDCPKPIDQLQQVRVLRRGTPKIQASWFPEGLETTIYLRLEVTPQGQIGRIAFQPADTDPRIIKAIMQSLRQWKFKANQDGQPQAACFEQPYQLTFPKLAN